MDNMELKEFIEKTLLQVIQGVKSAQSKASELGAVVSPLGMRTQNKDLYILIMQGCSMPLGKIEFEAALTKSESEGGKSGIGVFLGGVGFGGQSDSTTQNHSMTKIKFSVPILLPCFDFDKACFVGETVIREV